MEIIPVYQQLLKVLPSDIDELNHANNICYVRWMQEVALQHSAAIGWSTKQYTDLGATWVVRRHCIDYLHQGFLEDTVLAETWISDMKNVSSVRRYRFTRLTDGLVLAKAETRWGFISLVTGRPTRIPPAMFTIFQQCLEGVDPMKFSLDSFQGNK